MRNPLKITLFAAVLICGASACSQPQDNQTKAETLVQAYLDTTLNDPKSYEPVSFGKIRKLEDTLVEWQGIVDTVRYGGQYSISHTYRAKNGMGGTITKTDHFHIDSLFKSIKGGFTK